jgi:RNA recognition motif-containing protein
MTAKQEAKESKEIAAPTINLDENGMIRLYIGGLAPQTTPEEIGEKLDNFGKTQSVELIKDIKTG